ncbi:wee1-like protein kinase [Phymastichus coffea]|uniref:wee1-like protein kinase n=1 Tax=Phymastichus coffea TaxID=108790 RepID=UPI00273C08F7|nr:wee1-like protein kinase [Phymastichus coffea]XP_058803700.1 wee1-like protein kinase [Phymastichus coffea]
MAWMNSLYSSMKAMFSTLPSAPQNNPQEDKSREKRAQLTVTANPFAPIEEVDFIKIVDDTTIHDQVKSQRKGAMARKILCSALCKKADKGSTVTLASTSLSTTLDLSSCTTRYKREFHELSLIGSGTFGSVYRCINRLDGRVYAVKRSRLLAGSKYAQRRAKNEVHANAVLNNHPNVVRYYSAWIEDNRMNILQEYCTGGDLAALIKTVSDDERWFTEEEVYRILLDIAKGLQYVHGNKLAHMDIKPENIFISRERVWTPRRQLTCERSGAFIRDYFFEEQVVYKIGDFSHVASIIDTTEIDDEGDCRYLCREVMREDYTDLAKADMFALGLTIYEVAGGGPLPKNGPKWQAIRDGDLSILSRYNDKFNQLIRAMASVDPSQRPSAADVVNECLYTER